MFDLELVLPNTFGLTCTINLGQCNFMLACLCTLEESSKLIKTRH